MMILSKWLPTRNFGKKTYSTFWNGVPNNANDNRKQEIYSQTEDLYWHYLGDGKPQGTTKSQIIDHYSFPLSYDYDLMRKTIQGNHRKENKVHIWIGTMEDGPLPQENGFYKIIYDPANEKHTLSRHNKNATVIWDLGFSEVDGSQVIPMAINYK
jgi:hypothetical protein